MFGVSCLFPLGATEPVSSVEITSKVFWMLSLKVLVSCVHYEGVECEQRNSEDKVNKAYW